jgi:CAP-Gly domain-containing linker protein 1
LESKIEELTRKNDEVSQENRRLMEAQQSLVEAHRQVENECLKLMDELERLHSEQLSLPPIAKEPEVDAGIKLDEFDEDPNASPEQRRLLELLKTKQSQLEAQQRAFQQERLKLQQRIDDLEHTHRLEIEQRDRDIADLESLVESKIFREADLEEQLERQMQLVKQLQRQLGEGGASANDMVSRSTSMGRGLADDASAAGSDGAMSRTRSSRSNRDFSRVYCEICEVEGHDLMSCPKVMGTPSMNMTSSNLEIDDDEQYDQPYCDICESFGAHWTEDCPNANEVSF